MRKVYVIATIGFIAVVSILLSVYRPEEVVDDSHLTILVGNLAGSLDPIDSDLSATAQFSRLVYQTLFLLDYDTSEIIPSLAVSYNFTCPQTVEIEIQGGVSFHNGDSLTAHDVAFTLNRLGGAWQVRSLFGMIDLAKAHDNYSLTVYLEKPFGPILHHLAHPAASIVSMNHFYAVGSAAFASYPIGSGMFKLDYRIIGNRISLVRFENYIGGASELERITFWHVPHPEVRLMRMLTEGNSHIALDLPSYMIPRLDAEPRVVNMRKPSMSVEFITFNTKSTYLDNPLVRQAIGYAFDIETVYELLFAPLGGEIATTPLPQGVWGHKAQPPFETDIDRARELLTYVGLYPLGFKIEIKMLPSRLHYAVAEMLQFALMELNITVSINVWFDSAHFMYATAAGEHQMVLTWWTNITGEADSSLFPLFHSSNIGASNRSFWHNQDIDNLLEKARAETDPSARLQIYAEALGLIRNYEPLLTLYQSDLFLPVDPRITNFELSPTGIHNFGTIRLKPT